MKPTIYIDSTVPSYWLPQGDEPILHARHLMTRRWWSDELPRFEPLVSAVVLDELADGDPQRAKTRTGLVQGMPLLEVDLRVEKAAHFYGEQMAMPKKDIRDAFHLALASVHGIEYLLTWNYAHLANARKRRHIEVLNRRLGLSSPVICSPEDLILEE